MDRERRIQIHATTVLLENAGVALTGPSGSGKSDLALRLIDGGAQLVADDRTNLTLDGGKLVASPPAGLAGLLEIRGYGIVRLPWVPAAPLRLVVLLSQHGEIPRLPEPAARSCLGVAVPLIRLCGFDASATARLRFAAGQLAGPADRPG